MAKWALALLLAVSAGCAPLLRLRVPLTCPDGLPPLILQHPACPPDGVCGYSCEPGRWGSPPGEKRAARKRAVTTTGAGSTCYSRAVRP